MLDLIALVAIFVSLPDVHVTFAPSAAFLSDSTWHRATHGLLSK